MNTQMIVSGLRARPVRTAVGILAVTLEVVLILLLVGLTSGTLYEVGNRVAGVGAEILFKDEDSSYMVGMNEAILPVEGLSKAIGAVEGVQAVAPVLTQTETGAGFTVVYGIDLDSFKAVSGGFTMIKGQLFSAPFEAVIDDRHAGTNNLDVGSKIKVKNRDFTVTGIVESGKGARIFIPLTTAQEMKQRPGLATMFYIKLRDNADTSAAIKKADTKAAIQRLEKAFEGERYEFVDVDDFVSLMFEDFASLIGVVFKVIVFLGASIGVLVIFLSTYTTVTERTREIGILRSMGASKAFIVGLVVQESLLLCAIGAIVGLGTSFAAAALLKKLLPTLIIMIDSGWIIRATLFALLSGVIGALYPAYKAASQDPIEALAYE
jgi:putative ABC transport system permease protein